MTKEEEIELLLQMVGIYPGDPDGSIMRYVCELQGIEYDPPEVTVTYY